MSTVAEQMESKILAIIDKRGSILFEELLACLPESTWNQVFIGMDSLSRQGSVCLRRRGVDYELRVPPLVEPQPCLMSIRDHGLIGTPNDLQHPHCTSYAI